MPVIVDDRSSYFDSEREKHFYTTIVNNNLEEDNDNFDSDKENEEENIVD